MAPLTPDEDDSQIERLLGDFVPGSTPSFDPERLCAEHPALGSRLRDCFAALDFLGQAREDEAASAHFAQPTRLGDFRVLREAGRGGMGVVYEAEQISLRRRVALKVLPLSPIVDPRQLKRFHIEAQAAAQLHHTNIVPVYAVGSEDGAHYYAMQYVEGSTLASVIGELRGLRRAERSGAQPPSPPSSGTSAATRALLGCRTPATPLDFDESVESVPSVVPTQEFFRAIAGLAAQAADGLEHAHRQGVVHRDVKPSNLLLDAGGHLWVTDFGLAKLRDVPAGTLTGDVLGTLPYMSPEQALGRKEDLDQRTDVYSLGATLYELATLRPLFEGRDRETLLRRIAFEEPARPRRRERAVPEDLETILLKAVAKDPRDRYPDAGALALDLRRFIENRPVEARRVSAVKRLSRWARREKAKAALAGFLALGVPTLAALATWAVTNHSRIIAAAEHARLGRAEALVDEGFFLLGDWNLERALDSFHRALAVDACNSEAIAGAAIALNRRTSASERRDYWETLVFLDLHPVDPREQPALHRIRADALRMSGRNAEADALDSTLGPPATALEFFVEGERAWGPGGKEAAARAQSWYARACAASPRARPPFYQARAEAAMVAQDDAAIRETVEAMRTLWPNSSRTWFCVGEMLSLIDRAGAVDAYEKAIELDQAFFGARCSLGSLLLDANDLAGAIALFRSCIELNPDDHLAPANLGRALLASGHRESGMAALRTAIENEPRYSAGHVWMARALRDAGNSAGAVAAYRQALDRGWPVGAPLYEEIGIALRELDDPSGARLAFERALRVDPSFTAAREHLAQVLVELGDREGAIAELRSLVDALPTARSSHEALLSLLEAALDVPGRRAELVRWVTVEPTDSSAWTELTRILTPIDPAEALKAARRAVALSDEEDPAALDVLAHALFANGDSAGALEAEEKALELLSAAPADSALRASLEAAREQFRSTVETAVNK